MSDPNRTQKRVHLEQASHCARLLASFPIPVNVSRLGAELHVLSAPALQELRAFLVSIESELSDAHRKAKRGFL